MGAELGRISGPLLAANLLRHGTDLTFRNGPSDPDILYLDVTNGRIGVNTTTPTRELSVNGTTTTTNLLVDTQATISDINLVSYRIQNALGAINVVPNQATDPTVVINDLQTSKLDFKNRTVSTRNLNDNIELTANGTGKVVFTTSKVNVNGDLHATGNITWDGNITLGDSNLDSVVFASDFASDLVPDLDNQYDLGSSVRNLNWNAAYLGTLTANAVNLDSLTVNNIDMLLTQGNTIYVSVNGNDTYTGTHQHSTYRTIKHALSVATSGDNIVIFPGTYEEIFPLTVPQGVSVTGAGLRAVTITPTSGTNTKDAFLLNGETTVMQLSIKDVSYDSVNDIGYAFRFAPGFKVTTRSPYIQNVTVINQGPNAGRGALVDGSVADPTSFHASMLFHAVTFIVPNADAVIATNGSRVEWLNSFSYFAYRGIHLTRGTLGFASLGVKFGAELRSINSANVYGTYGAVADGIDTLGYLIGHNFGYIGTGLDTNNDANLSLQANEVVQINGGVIYFDSMDHKGDYRVGEIFYVNQQTGQVSFNAQSINFNATGNITIDGPTGQIIVDATKVQVSNLRIHDNNIDSLIGPVNFSAQSGTTTLNTTVNVTGNTNVTGDTIVKGNVFLGNNPLDLITIAPNLTQNIVPGLNNTFNLGSKSPASEIWKTAFITAFNVDGITQVTNNTISTLTSNTDLKFQAAGTGKIHVTSTDVQIDQNLTVSGIVTVNGATALRDTDITGTVTLVGNIGQTGDTYITGLFSNNNITLTGAHSYISVPDLKIQDNNISATYLNDDIHFVGNGTAGVVFDNKIKIVDNVLSNVWAGATTNAQKSIIFTPNGTGIVVISSTKHLTVPYSNDSTKVLSTPGEIRQNSTTTAYEGYLSTGTESFTNVYSTDKKTYITPELTIGANDNILRLTINNVVKGTIDSAKVSVANLQVGNFVISNNTINNPVTNSDSIFQPNGTGFINANGLLFKDSSISNTLNTPVVLESTGTGYIKFGGTGAVVLPYGPSSDRRLTPETGETRYNSTVNYMEVFDGTHWIPAVGTLGAASLTDVLDIMDIYSLILG
jgi:hypothetical protein